MEQRITRPKRLEGSFAPPGDKSISHRAMLLNAIANGTSTISNFCQGDDRSAMLTCLKGLGANIQTEVSADGNPSGDLFKVHSHGMDNLKEPDEVLYAGNSGTTIRLVSGLLAGQPFLTIISGDSSLRSRPMDRILLPLKEMGAEIMGRRGGTLAPLAIHGGRLHGIKYALPVASAQLKSCLIIASLFAEGETVLQEPAVSRDHTERMLQAMGANLAVADHQITVRASSLNAIDVRVPGDISAAAYWLVAGCCHPNAQIRVEGVGINPTRTGVLEVLESMGAKISYENIREEGGEPTADIIAESSALKGTCISGDIIGRLIDELPLLALAACFAEGVTVIQDAQELVVKESDRIWATVDGLSRMGASISSGYQGTPVSNDSDQRDGMIIEGVEALKAGNCLSHGDHRIAMTMGIAGLLAEGQTLVYNAEASDISYPGFWEEARHLEQGDRLGN
jgi:3-phosphoshikimate 1-carboxyvinyltransferase